MKRFAAVLFVLLAVVLSLPVNADAASTTPVESFAYTCKAPGTVLLNQYIGASSTVTVPDKYLIDGKTYCVELASETVFAGNTKLTAVTISSGVTFENASMRLLFAKCAALKTVKLHMDTSAVTDMSYLFYGCEALETLDVSSLNTANVTTMKGMFSYCGKLKKLTGYEKWNTASLRSIAYMFNLTQQLKTVDLSHWTLAQLENSAWCFQKCGATKLLLPEDLAIISAGFLNHVDAYAGSSFTIPAGVKKIGYAHTIYDFATDSFTEFHVAEGNTAYKAVDGILYSADGTEMLAIPRGKTFQNGIYEIPQGVTFLGELSFSRNYNIEKLILPDTYILKNVPLNDPAYITFEDTGNLNSGLNLNIAIYSYTGIKSYAVRESNPHYKGIDGILYTKDGQSLVAVPTRYEGKIHVPEGVATWQTAAMWDAGDLVDSLMNKCTGVSIPASMTQISPEQLEKLNRLESRYSAFQITVSEENPVYYVGKSGQLLKKPNIADLQVTLSQDTFVYDGEPKTPKPTIIHKGKTLKEGKDYTLSYLDNTNAGTGWVRITGMADLYGTVECAFTIQQAQPVYSLPQGLTAIYGQAVGEVLLPEGFAWMQPDTPVGQTGSNSHKLRYTNGDPNYVQLTDLPVSVTVQPKPIDGKCIFLIDWYPWTGKPIQPAVSVMDTMGTVPAEEYTVSYQQNLWFGRGTVILADVPGGNYQVDGKAEFYIVPGPFLCTAALTFLWCLTTGLPLRKKAVPSKKPSKNQ